MRLLPLLLALSFAATDARAATCRVVDATAPFWPLAHEAEDWPPEPAAAAFRARVVAPHAALYAPEVIDAMAPDELDRRAVHALATARSRGFAGEALQRNMVARLPGWIAAFHRAFPDFRCDFPIYLTIALDRFDGAGRLVAGKPALVFGIDAMVGTQTDARLPVFVTHELFHRYHQQAAGFSDDPGARQPIWRVLWAEGLATLASLRLNPTHKLVDALLLPEDLETRAKPLLPKLAAELASGAETVATPLYDAYFVYGSAQAKAAGIPDRAGYYVGYRIAERAARGHDLAELAHWPASRVQREVQRQLNALTR